MVKLIATDMDGTLLSMDQTISAYNLDALKSAHEAGIHLAVASGRAPFEILHLTKKIDHIPLGLICLNGAYVRTPDGREDSHPLPVDLFTQCVDMAEAAGIRYYFYTVDRLHSNMASLKEYPTPLKVVNRDEAVALAGKAMKFVAYEPDLAKLSALRSCVEQMDLTVCSSWAGNFEVTAAGVDKGTALAEMAELLGVAQEDVMALGDQENDLSMLCWAGVSVAMENATDQVKRNVRHVTRHHNEGGVGHAIHTWALS